MAGEVATYVLAYLLRMRYQATATAFLQECTLLPSKSLLVLPETSLETIISEYKAHKDTRVLVDTLGEQNTWSALWDKVEQNMAQLRRLSEEMSLHSNSAHRGGGRRRTRLHWNTVRAQPPVGTPSQHQPAPQPLTFTQPQTSTAFTVSTSTDPHQHSLQPSPQKRKTVPPRRKAIPATSIPPEPSLEATPTDMQQVLETMLCNGSLPEKLAEIINKVVGRDSEEDGSSERLELSPGTLDSILDLTCAAPEFEGVLGTVERLPDPPKLTHRAVEVRILAPHQPLPLPSHQPHPLPSHQPHPLQPQLQPNECDKPAQKRQRISAPEQSLPSELDIESFLDQLHS